MQLLIKPSTNNWTCKRWKFANINSFNLSSGSKM